MLPRLSPVLLPKPDVWYGPPTPLNNGIGIGGKPEVCTVIYKILLTILQIPFCYCFIITN